MTSTMTSTMSESGFPLWGEDIQRTINMCSGLVALTREDFINPPRIPTSDELESNFLSSINYVTRSPTYESFVPGSISARPRSLYRQPGNDKSKKLNKITILKKCIKRLQ